MEMERVRQLPRMPMDRRPRKRPRLGGDLTQLPPQAKRTVLLTSSLGKAMNEETNDVGSSSLEQKEFSMEIIREKLADMQEIAEYMELYSKELHSIGTEILSHLKKLEETGVITSNVSSNLRSKLILGPRKAMSSGPNGGMPSYASALSKSRGKKPEKRTSQHVTLKTRTLSLGQSSKNAYEVFKQKFISDYRLVTRRAYCFRPTNNSVYFPLHERNNVPLRYPRMITVSGAKPENIYKLFKFGYLHAIYIDRTSTELAKLPMDVRKAVETYRARPNTKEAGLCMQFYSAGPDINNEAITLVQISRSSKTNEVPLTQKWLQAPLVTDEWVETRRALGLYVLRKRLESILEFGRGWIYYWGPKLMIFFDIENHVLNAVSKAQIDDAIQKIYSCKVRSTLGTRQKLCELLKHIDEKDCDICKRKVKTKDISLDAYARPDEFKI